MQQGTRPSVLPQNLYRVLALPVQNRAPYAGSFILFVTPPQTFPDVTTNLGSLNAGLHRTIFSGEPVNSLIMQVLQMPLTTKSLRYSALSTIPAAWSVFSRRPPFDPADVERL